MRTFVYTDAKSNKFWNIELKGKGFTVTFGRVGTKGQTQTKDFPDEEKARKAHDKLVAEKLGKGYVETTAARAPSPPALQQSLEEALAENPDDLSAHHAYADYLMEQGDPRGELIQAQLALENAGLPGEERTRLQEREKELLDKHSRQWLGDLARLLIGKWSGPDKPYHYRLARGWLDLVRVLPFPDGVVAAVARSPQVRLLRRLEVVYDMRYHPWDFDQFVQGPAEALGVPDADRETYEPVEVMPPLLDSPYLTNLRALKVGFSDSDDRIAHSTMVDPFGGCDARQVIGLLKKCPRLEELYLNTHLPGIERLFALPELGNVRVLQYYFGMNSAYNREDAYPLTALANNSSLKRLTTLRLHPGRDTTVALEEFDALLRSPHLRALTHLQVHMTTFGDEGCRRIVESGVLKRLKVLDLAYGNMTDEGARLLAGSPDLKNLERLDVSRNALTAEGIAALRTARAQTHLWQTPIQSQLQVVADDQHGAGEQDYLYEVDLE